MQATHEVAPHLETLKRALGDKIGTQVTEEDLQSELAKYLDYGVPPDQAVRTILRHHGAGTPAPGGAGAATAPSPPPGVDTSERLPLTQVVGGLPFVRLKVRFLTINTKLVNARGEQKEIFWGLLGDESGTAEYTSWRPLEGLAKGDVVEVEGAYTKEWNGRLQINFGDRTRLEKRAADDLPETPVTYEDVAIGDLRQGLRGLRVKGRLLDVSPREITVQGEPRTIYGGTLADASGRVEFTAWHDHGLQADTVVTIEGGYVREFRGMPQLNFDAEASITVHADEAEAGVPAADELAATSTMTLGDLAERGAGEGAFVGTLLEVRPGSGLIYRDPETKRVVQPNDPGAVPDLRIKGILDDGTGAVNFVATTAITQELLGKTVDQCIEEARNAMRTEVIHDQLAAKLTGFQYVIEGFARTDDYGLMLIARSMKRRELDAEGAAKDLLATMAEKEGA